MGYDQYFPIIIFAAATKLNILFKYAAWFFIYVSKNFWPYSFLNKKFNCVAAAKIIMAYLGLFSIHLTFIFFKFLFFERNRMVTKSKLYLLWQVRFWSLAPFFSEVTHGQNCDHGPKTTSKRSGRVLAFPFKSYLKIEVSKMIGMNPPPLSLDWKPHVLVWICILFPMIFPLFPW